jgi:hypothetical protein
MPLSVLRPNDLVRVINIEGHWGRDPNAVMPPVAADAAPLVPNANYGYDAATNLWLPMAVSSSGAIIEAFSQLIANLLATLNGTAASIDDTTNEVQVQLGSLLGLVNTRLRGNSEPYLWESTLNAVNALGFRKILGVDAGAYVAPAAGATTMNYTGVNLAGRTCGVAWNITDRKLYQITTVTDPAGANPGVITFATPVTVAAGVWVVPYLAVPHAYSTTTDSLRATNIAPEWSHYVEPTVLISQTAATANNTYQFGPIPCLDYGRFYFEIVWSNAAGARTIQFRLYGKMSPTAWAAAGAIPAALNIDSLPQYNAGSLAFGSPPFAGGATPATSGWICGRLQDAAMYDSLMVEMVVTNSDANNTTVTGYYGLSGNAR